jgi:protein ImuB
VIVPYNADRDARMYEPLVQSIGTLVPLIDVETPGSLLLATRGPSRYVGGDDTLAVRLLTLAREGLSHTTHGLNVDEVITAGGGLGVGIADGRIAATLASRSSSRRGEPVVIQPGMQATAEFLAPYAVKVLTAVAGCSPDLIDLLERLGLRQLGDIARLSVTDLVGRFGSVGETLHRLASGTDDTPPSTIPPPPDLMMVRVFDDPLSQLDMLVFAAKALTDELGSYFHERGQVCTRIQVDAESEHGESSQRVWYHAEGMRSTTLLDRVRWQLDGWINGNEPPTAGVTLLRLTPMDIRSDAGTQSGFWGGRSEADDNATRAITRVIGLLGPQSVTVASWRGGRDPREVYEMMCFADIGSADSGGVGRQLVLRPDDDANATVWPGSLPAPAPAVVHHEPLLIEVIDTHGRGVAVNGRGLVSAAPATLVQHGKSRRIVAWAGPWPVDERWWDQRARRAARFQLVIEQPDGQCAYLAEVAAGKWWLTAEYS